MNNFFFFLFIVIVPNEFSELHSPFFFSLEKKVHTLTHGWNKMRWKKKLNFTSQVSILAGNERDQSVDNVGIIYFFFFPSSSFVCLHRLCVRLLLKKKLSCRKSMPKPYKNMSSIWKWTKKRKKHTDDKKDHGENFPHSEMRT